MFRHSAILATLHGSFNIKCKSNGISNKFTFMSSICQWACCSYKAGSASTLKDWLFCQIDCRVANNFHCQLIYQCVAE